MVGSIFNAPDVIYPDNFKYFVEDLKPKLLWFISLLLTGFKTWRRSFFLECSVPWPHVDYQTVAFLFGSQVKTSNEKIKRTRQLSSPLPQRRRTRRDAAHDAAAAADWLRGNSKLEKTEFLPRQLVRVTWCCLIAALWCGACCLYTLGKIQPLLVILVGTLCLFNLGFGKLEKTEFMPRQLSGGGKQVEKHWNRFSQYLS